MPHPQYQRGTPEHRGWVVGRIRAHLERGGSPSRDDFLPTERLHKTSGAWVTKTDVGSEWTALLAEAQGIAAPHKAQATVDVSGLDWDPEEDDTQPQRVPLTPIPDGHFVKGVSTFVDSEGNTRGQWVKTAKEYISREEILAKLLEDLPETVPQRIGTIPAPDAPGDADLLAAYVMGDPHFGLLAWGPESGGDNFDLPTARDLTRAAVDSLTANGPRSQEALLISLGDFYHSDTPDNKTRRSGNPLDVDGRWFKVLRVGIDAMVYAIDSCLRAHERVTFVSAVGNHDDTSALMLAVALDHHYRNEPRVEVVCNPALFTYRRFGRCLIGVHHGHTTKHDDLESIMASDRPQDWGETLHRYWYVGHIHHKRQIESRGCLVEAFRSLTGKDAWHHGQGYRSGRDMTRIALHREWGEVSRSTVSAAYLRSQLEAAA